jgi:hypothetical protein
MCNEVTGSRVLNPGGVIIDRSVMPNRMYVYDGGNSRVLGVILTPTVDLNGRQADLVLGQPGLDGYAACNGDGNFFNYPTRAPASASTLCSMPESQISPREGGSFANMAVDAAGSLRAGLRQPSRMLYLSPFTTDGTRDAVWGQANFADNTCNEGRGVGQPDGSLCLPDPFSKGFVGGVGLDASAACGSPTTRTTCAFPYDAFAGNPRKRRIWCWVSRTTSGQPVTPSAYVGAAAVRVSPGGTVYWPTRSRRVLIFRAAALSSACRPADR